MEKIPKAYNEPRKAVLLFQDSDINRIGISVSDLVNKRSEKTATRLKPTNKRCTNGKQYRKESKTAIIDSLESNLRMQ